MDVLDSVLTQHERPRRERTLAAVDFSWLNNGRPIEERLAAFDRWLRAELTERLVWDWAGGRKQNEIEQSRLYVQRLVVELWRRGWMLDGKALADRITGMLDAVGAYQRTGKVQRFWPYFRATVDRYVGANAEELQAEAMRLGSHLGQLVGAIDNTITQAIANRTAEVHEHKAKTIREKEKALRARSKADATQLPLL